MKEEVKSKADIVQIAEREGFQINGGGFIHSIYKDEKEPSLKLYPKTNSYFCFATNQGGDVLKFYQDLKRISFKEALDELAEIYHVSGNNNNYAVSTNNKSKVKEGKMEEVHINILDEESIGLQKAIIKDFMDHCSGSDELSLKYLMGSKRGLTEETIKRFGLCSVKDPTATKKYLTDKYKIEQLILSGLYNEKGNFVFGSHRIIIPYFENCEVVYLRGRSTEDKGNRYIGLCNTAGNLTAKRVFNRDILKELNEDSEILVCEGEFDTMIAVQCGYKAIGIPGVNNYPSNLKQFIKPYEIILAFDNDDAGRKGNEAICNHLQKSVNVLHLKKHNDLTELVVSGGTKIIMNKEYSEIKKLEPVKYQQSCIRLLSAKQIQDIKLEPIQWLADGFLTEGLFILAGPPKVGKSWLSLNIALSVAKGTMVLSSFKTNKAGVVYLALEDNHRRIQSRIQNNLYYETDKKAPDNLYFPEITNNVPKLNEGGIDELEKLVLDHPEVKLIIIDTLGRIRADKRRGDNNIYLADYELLAELQEFALRNKICVLVVHHTKKGSEENVFEEISGTTGITGAADAMMVLKKVRGEHKLFITGRDIVEAEYKVAIDEKSCIWYISEEVKDAKRITVEREQILALLRDYGRGMKTGEIADLLGKEKSNISKLLKKLIEDKYMVSPKYGYYELVKETDQNESLAV